MTPILERLNALFEKATPGEWQFVRPTKFYQYSAKYEVLTQDGPIMGDSPAYDYEVSEKDAELIAALHNAYPELRARIEALEAALRIIAGQSKWPNDLLSGAEIARAALAGSAT